MELKPIPQEELESLLELMYEYSGIDFTGYAKASLKRRIRRLLNITNSSNLYDLKYKLINDKSFMVDAINEISVNVTEMFRDPSFYKTVKDEIVPILRTYPRIKVWHAGCSTGEEVYSFRILMEECGLGPLTKSYATDINHDVLEAAREAIYDAKLLKKYSINYQKSGGQKSLSDYFVFKYGKAIVDSELRKNIVFGQHNLITDKSFNEFNVIVCRNVLIYFDREFQNKCFDLFYESLPVYGILMLGQKESLLTYDKKDRFEPLNRNEKIFRKIK